MTDLLLTDAELHALTGYRQAAAQLAELRRDPSNFARADRASIRAPRSGAVGH